MTTETRGWVGVWGSLPHRVDTGGGVSQRPLLWRQAFVGGGGERQLKAALRLQLDD